MTNQAESSQVWFATALTGPLLNDEEMARKFAVLMLERLHGAAKVAKQQPLHVMDQGTDWVVMGSNQEPGRLPDTGAWFVRVRKSDCCVLKFGHYEPLDIPDDVKSIISAATPR